MAADSADLVLDGEIAAAKEALVDEARADAARWWTAYELKTRARNGWGAGVMGIALRELVATGVFERRRDLRVRLHA